jgi:hypothetical protein
MVKITAEFRKLMNLEKTASFQIGHPLAVSSSRGLIKPWKSRKTGSATKVFAKAK